MLHNASHAGTSWPAGASGNAALPSQFPKDGGASPDAERQPSAGMLCSSEAFESSLPSPIIVLDTATPTLCLPIGGVDKLIDNFTAPLDVHSNPLYLHRRLILDSLRNELAAIEGDVLDVGCGIQPYRSLFTKASSYTGVDIDASPHQLSAGTVIFDGVHLPFADATFDAILSSEVFEHVREPLALAKDIGRVLRPHGRLILTVPFISGVHEAPNDFQRWTNFGLHKLLTEAGLQEIEVTPLGNWHHALAMFLAVYHASVRWPWWTRGWLPRVSWWIRRRIASLNLQTNSTMCVGWFVRARRE